MIKTLQNFSQQDIDKNQLSATANNIQHIKTNSK